MLRLFFLQAEEGIRDLVRCRGLGEVYKRQASYARRFIAAGVRLVGGCCGTTPEHIRQIARAVRDLPPRRVPRIEAQLRLSGLEAFTLRSEPDAALSFYPAASLRVDGNGRRQSLRFDRETEFAGSERANRYLRPTAPA